MLLAAQERVAAPGETLQRYYLALFDSFGPQGWWPARTRLEVILGAILTQNTTWRNASLAIKELKKAGLLSWAALRDASTAALEACVRPAGFYRQKARTIRGFVEWLQARYSGSLDAFFALEPSEGRKQLLRLHGIGPETTDAILLYAGRQATFVADAYTRRVLARHGLIPDSADYESARQFLHQHLPQDQAMFNEFHALLVEVAKRHCRKQVADCGNCALRHFLADTNPASTFEVNGPAETKASPQSSQRLTESCRLSEPL